MQSEESTAPWNQEELQPLDVDCCVSYCMSKTMTIPVKNYKDEGGSYDFSDTNLIDEFSDSDALGLTYLLTELLRLSEEKITSLEDELNLTSSNNKAREQIQRELQHYKNVSKASKGWIVDDLDVEIEN